MQTHNTKPATTGDTFTPPAEKETYTDLINAEEKDADGESVWLNEDYQEVDPDAEPDYDEESEVDE